MEDVIIGFMFKISNVCITEKSMLMPKDFDAHFSYISLKLCFI